MLSIWKEPSERKVDLIRKINGTSGISKILRYGLSSNSPSLSPQLEHIALK
eukprot:c37859_g1_i1 orf=2-151(-)